MSGTASGETQSGSARNSALVAAGIFLSRLLGLARQALIARYLGAGMVSDAFNGAFRITNILQNLFGEGALSASFIPVYSRAVGRGERDDADRVAGASAAILALLCAILVAAGVTAAPWVVELVVGGFTGEKRRIAITLTRILFPGAAIFVMSAWCLGILNSHRRFFLSYAAPVVWNIAMIAALLTFGYRRSEYDLAVIIAWASVIGAFLQFAIQLPAVFSLLGSPRFRLDTTFPPVREVLRNFMPAFVTRGVVQLSSFVDIRIASSIATDGVVTLLQNAQTIYMLPISLFGMAVSAAELPELSRDGGTDEAAFAKLRARLNVALARVAFFVIPSAIAFMVLGEAIAGILLEHGKFERSDTVRTWAILGASAVGLVPGAMGRLYSSTFYALRDTRTPLRFAIARVVFTGVLGYVFAFPLPQWLGLAPWTGAVGLALSSGLAGTIEYLLLRHSIARRIGPTRIPPAALARLLMSAMVAAACGYGVMSALDPARQTLRSVVSLAVFAVAYGVASLALGVPDARSLAARIRRR